MEATHERPEDWRRSKRPRSIVAGTYGDPVHPILVTIPIGAWFASLVFDCGSRLGGPAAALATGSSWLMALGNVGAVATAVTGFIDLQQVPAGSHVMRVGIVHMGLNLTAATMYVTNAVVRLSQPDEAGVPLPLLLWSAGTFALLAAGSHLGGSLTYRFGVRVADETTQVSGYATHPGGTA